MRIRDARVGVRLSLAFGAVIALLLVQLVVAMVGASAQHGAIRAVDANEERQHLAQELKFLAADVNGWQNQYIIDAQTDPPEAVEETNRNRRTFLDRVAEMRAGLARVRAGRLTDRQAAAAAAVERSLDRFMALDGRAVELLRQGTPATTAEATELVLTEATAAFETMAAGAEQLAQRFEEANQERIDSAGSAYSQERTLALGTSALAVLVAVGLASAITRSVTHPLRRMTTILQSVAAGDLTPRVGATTGDELGRIGAALDDTLDRMRATLEEIAGSSAVLSSSSEELSAVSQQMSAAAEETAAQSGSVSAAAEQVSHNVQSVAAGAEQLGASIHEIARNTTDAAAVAAQAVSLAEATDETVRKLGAGSVQIGEVIKVITAIAEQTNLLALNATIEAARAGDAGRGFAVVASEVKDLARKTARSSDEIARTVESIQADSARSAAAIGEIRAIVARIDEIQAAVAAAVEQQAATTSEISRSVTEAAAGSTEIARNITGVADSARGTTQGASETHRSAEELARLAAQLLGLVHQFRLGDGAPVPSLDRPPALAASTNGGARPVSSRGGVEAWR